MSENTVSGGFDPVLHDSTLVRTYKKIINAIIKEMRMMGYSEGELEGGSLYWLFYKYRRTWESKAGFDPQKTPELYNQLCEVASICFKVEPEILELFYTLLNKLHTLVTLPTMTKAIR